MRFEDADPELGATEQVSASRREGTTTIVLVDAVRFRRDCIARSLEISAEELRIEAIESADEWAAAGRRADLVLLHVAADHPPDQRIIETVEYSCADAPNLPIVVLSDHEDPSLIAKVVAAGARGYVPTSYDLTMVVGVLRFVLAGGTFVPADVLIALQRPAPDPGPATDDVQPSSDREATAPGVASGIAVETERHLTRRQLEVLSLLRQGKANKIIAYELNMRESTVKVHIRNIMHKLRVSNRTEAAWCAHRIFGSDGARGGNGAAVTLQAAAST
jgi:DNA-binding NarL/FixJ family response regulator